MSYCPKCGTKTEAGKFRCPSCGSLLVYGSMGRRRSMWSKIKNYKNIFILIALAAAIAITRSASTLTIIYWLIVGGIVAALILLWLRSRNKSEHYNNWNYHQSSRKIKQGKSRHRTETQEKMAKVIPFRKRDDSKQRAEQDR